MDTYTTSWPIEAYVGIVILVLVFIAIIKSNFFPGMPRAPKTWNPWEQEASDNAFMFWLRETFIYRRKVAAGELFDNLIKGGGSIGAYIVILLALVLAVVSIIALADFFGLIKHETKVYVQEGEICTGTRNNERVTLVKGTEKIEDDICNNEPVVIAPEPSPTTAATQTLSLPSPTTQGPTQEVVQQFASATPAPTEQPGKLIKVVWLDGHSAEQGWMKVPSLDGYNQVGESKCRVYETESLQIPSGETFAFVLFEGGRNNFMISDSLVNLSGTVLTLNQNMVEIGGCIPGSWFSIWVK